METTEVTAPCSRCAAPTKNDSAGLAQFGACVCPKCHHAYLAFLCKKQLRLLSIGRNHLENKMDENPKTADVYEKKIDKLKLEVSAIEKLQDRLTKSFKSRYEAYPIEHLAKVWPRMEQCLVEGDAERYVWMLQTSKSLGYI